MFIYGCDGEYTLGFHTYLSQSLYLNIQKIIDTTKYFMLIKIKGQHFFVSPFSIVLYVLYATFVSRS